MNVIHILPKKYDLPVGTHFIFDDDDYPKIYKVCDLAQLQEWERKNDIPVGEEPCAICEVEGDRCPFLCCSPNERADGKDVYFKAVEEE